MSAARHEKGKNPAMAEGGCKELTTTPSAEVQPQGDLGKSHPQFEPHSRTEGGHSPGGIWRVGPSSILSMADSEAASKSRPYVVFIIRSALVCLKTDNPGMTTKGTDTKAASKSRRWVAFLSGRPWFAWRQATQG